MECMCKGLHSTGHLQHPTQELAIRVTALTLCLLCALHKTLLKGPEDAWFCPLQVVASCLSMGYSSAPGVRQKGLAMPTVLIMDHLLVAIKGDCRCI